ncbi:hypothetical protein [Streptomyces sp. WMMB 322]|uniref:hypothetical protein n=1 Tax=Streptomyces sp. WMMB 322 TaxID=1286821 RepID=UPI000823D84F|nr:hypothetical protein [Streptomyces sp. WMMB 322]SCK28807.1 hypothetical protein H180DRAFT_02259 [Streptomyces sp. WMMB 322]
MSLRIGRMSLKHRIRRRSPLAQAPPDRDFAARIQGDLALDYLPDEDLAEDLTESLDMYVLGSKPRCEEAEYLELVEDAIERIARGS